MPLAKREKEKREHAKEQFKGLAQDIDIIGYKLTLALDDMRTKIYDTIRIKGDLISVFGHNGVGGVTSNKVCVRLDGRKADVLLDEELYSLLVKEVIDKRPTVDQLQYIPVSKEDIKKQIRNLDELSEIEEFRDHLPIFKALSNCKLFIIDVNHGSVVEETEKLRKDYNIIDIHLSDPQKSNKALADKYRLNLYDVERAVERHEKNKVKEGEKPAAGAFRFKFESLLFENELEEELDNIKRYNVVKVIDAPPKKKVNIAGRESVGVIATYDIVIPLDKGEAKVFVENSIYSKIESQFMSKGRTPQDVCDMISKSPKSLGDELQYFASILKELSKSNIKIVELSANNKNELREKAELLVEQNYIADQWRRGTGIPKEAVLKEILDTVKSAQKINEAFARYGIDARVKEALVVKEAELPERKVRKEAEKMEKPAAVEEAETPEFKAARANLTKLLDDWVEKGVPKKEGLLESMDQKILEKMLDDEIAEMKDRNTYSTKAIEKAREDANTLRYATAAWQDYLSELINEEKKIIEKNEKKIKVAEEALKLLKS